MQRELGIFPYSSDNYQAPRTSGLIGGVGDKSFLIPNPDNGILDAPPKMRGRIMGTYITPTCVLLDTNTTWHPIFAGDF
jgi:hypothetical protein